MNDTPLARKVAIVTGASRGIGAATARALAAAGASVVLAARSTDAINDLAAVLEQTHGTPALAVPTDVSDPESVQVLVERTLDRFGRLDAAVNNAAGGGHPPTPLANVAVEDFDSAIATSLRGAFLAMKYEIPAMLATGGGAIVNMSSTAGVLAVGGIGGYVAAKAGLIGLTKSAALDYAAAGIRINALTPGPIATEQILAREGAAEQMAARLPVRRMGRVEEVAAAVVWLCSDQSSFVTGAVIPVDGGMLAGIPPGQR